ncbi:TauD/TfdA family dioxygenase [Belnapia sp. T6]|uniref:TauD/TfdA family dioxygenase n=1 Tax=Belnapia mucosa TaxID=2804532 RepID=A0ABS1V486_9PROT|nr:TauD/TfdA family dioxygenase [Belnapia mucosa]MBL6456524.1 TauD/TfdA family dioxygenase [Belnapia mucosa]
MDMMIPTRFEERPLGPLFGAELRGLRIASDLTEAEFASYLDAFHRHHLLLLRDVPFDPAAHVAFSRRMGPLELHAQTRYTHPGHPEIFCVGNYTEDGEPRANFARGIEQWHADSSYRKVPSAASLFYGVICPPEGGETWFLDAAGAYAELPAAMKARIDGLRAVHSLATLAEWGRQHNPERPPLTEEQTRRWPPVSQPLVRVHPVSGVRSLFLCPAVISHVEGLAPEEGRALIDALMAHASQERYVYRHRWRAGDLVIWDNRCTLHTATLFDHERHVRLMHRTTVAGP